MHHRTPNRFQSAMLAAGAFAALLWGQALAQAAPATGDVTLGTVRQANGTQKQIALPPPVAGTVLKFTGNPADPVAAAALQVSDVTGLNTALGLLAPKSSPTFTGTITASGTVLHTPALDIVSQLKAWASAGAYQITAVPATGEPGTGLNPSNGLILSGNVKWPDGTLGVYTAGPVDPTWQVPNSYTLTYGYPVVLRTVTQATATRDATFGTLIAIPDLTVTP